MATIANKYKPVTLTPEQIQQAKSDITRFRQIEEKSNCGTVRALDKLADLMVKFANWQIKLSVKVRGVTTKIDAPCSITLSK